MEQINVILECQLDIICFQEFNQISVQKRLKRDEIV